MNYLDGSKIKVEDKLSIGKGMTIVVLCCFESKRIL
jgi:hypothetical protein